MDVNRSFKEDWIDEEKPQRSFIDFGNSFAFILWKKKYIFPKEFEKDYQTLASTGEASLSKVEKYRLKELMEVKNSSTLCEIIEIKFFQEFEPSPFSIKYEYWKKVQEEIAWIEENVKKDYITLGILNPPCK